MADQNSYGSFKHWSIGLVFPSGAAWLIATCMSFFWSSTSAVESICLALLFGVPMLVQFCGLKSLDGKFERSHELLAKIHESEGGTSAAPTSIELPVRANTRQEERSNALEIYSQFYLYAMALCLFAYNALWVAYLIGQHHYNWDNLDEYLDHTHPMGPLWIVVSSLLSGAAITIIAILLVIVMWMTRAVISGEARRRGAPNFLNLYYLRLGAAQAPYLTLVFFLTVFLGVSYLFGFAFAFHDKTRSSDAPALVMTNRLVEDPQRAFVRDASPTPTPESTPSLIATFKFDSARATAPIKDLNDQAASAVQTISEKTANDNPIRILIVGGADLTQIKSIAYQSNYELAEARALFIKNLLLTRLSSTQQPLRNVEWVCQSRPNEGHAVVSKRGRKPASSEMEGEADRKVEVFAQRSFESPTSLLVRHLRANHVKPLHLMDYIYFANYTITTTGYGDIVPNSVYSQFICSFANIAEVFFLVVFFNTLLSLVGRRAMERTADQIEDLHDKYFPTPRTKRTD